MIRDKLEYCSTYYNISEGLKLGFEWLKSENLTEIKSGRHEISGDNVYANVQTYETKDDANYEAHKKYIDIQYVVNGSEFIGVCDIKDCVTCEEYNSEKDIEFLKNTKSDEYQHIKEGEFIVLFPNDAHKPSITPNTKQEVKKVVVKVAVN